MHNITNFESDHEIKLFYLEYISTVNSKSGSGDVYKNKILSIAGIESILGNIRADKWLEDNPISYNALYQSLSSYDVGTLFHNYLKYTVFKVYSFDVFKTFLLDIVKKYNIYSLSYSNRLSSISFCIKDLTISEQDPVTHTNILCNMGDFKVILANNTGYEWRSIPNISHQYLFTVTAEAIGNNKPRRTPGSDYDCFHPHIYKKSVCQGSYKAFDQAYFDFEQIDILSYIYNICGVLTHYNPRSIHHPGADISLWIGTKCSVCYGYISEGQAKKACAKSGLFMHDDCSMLVDGKYYHPDQVKTCFKCNKNIVEYLPIGPRRYSCKNCQNETTSSLAATAE